MSTKINSIEPIDFPNGKDDTIKYFTELIYDKAPKDQYFEIFDFINNLELSEDDRKRIWYVGNDIQINLIALELAEVNGNKIRLIPKQKSDINVNFIGGDNYGVQSLSEKAEIKNDIKIPKKQNNNIWGISNFMFNIVTGVIIGVILLIISIYFELY